MTLVFECTSCVTLFLFAAAGWHRYLNWIGLTSLAIIFAAPVFRGWHDEVYGHFHSMAGSGQRRLCTRPAHSMDRPQGAHSGRRGGLACCIRMVAQPGNVMVARWAAGASAALLVLDAVRIKMPPRTVPGLYTWAKAATRSTLFMCLPCLWCLVCGPNPPAQAPPGAVAIALILTVGFGSVDVRMYRHLRKAVNDFSEEVLRRRVNIYAGTFMIASLIVVVVVD